VKAGHGIHGRTDKKNPWISELSGFLRTINKIDSVASVALSKQVSYRVGNNSKISVKMRHSGDYALKVFS
jgi:hypothetical protein